MDEVTETIHMPLDKHHVTSIQRVDKPSKDARILTFLRGCTICRSNAKHISKQRHIICRALFFLLGAPSFQVALHGDGSYIL